MNRPAAHTRAWETFETVSVSMLLIGLLLGFVFPLRLSALVPRAVTVILGVILLLASLVLIAKTRAAFRQAGQPTDPGSPTTRLITTGVFAWSRNPLYLAGMITFTGLAALLDSGWLLILLVPTVAAVHWVLIAPEERYLEATFGEPYRQYRKSVSRWVGRRG